MKKLIILLSILALNDTKAKIYCDIKGNVKNPGVYEIKENYTIQNIINDAGGLKTNSYTQNINLSKKVTDEMVIYIFKEDEIKENEELNNCICETTYKYVECQTNPIEEKNTSTTTRNTTNEQTTTCAKTTKHSSVTSKSSTTKTTTINESTKTSTTKQPITTTNVNTTNKSTMPVENVDKKININTATKEELITLNGLGEKKAEAIIEYRNNIGLFNTIEDIMNISGIGASTFEKIKDYIKV